MWGPSLGRWEGFRPTMLEDLDLSRAQQDQPYALECLRRLLSLVEEWAAQMAALQEEVQRQRDEIARLKGEQGKPDIKANTRKAPPENYSSERERHTPKAWSKGSKAAEIEIHRQEVLEIDRANLPPDAHFKGYEDVPIQDVIFRPENVLFHKAKYYSKVERQAYLAPLPEGYQGQFGPGIKSLIKVLYFGSRMTEPKIAELLHNVGVRISHGQVSNLLIEHQEAFHEEKDAMCQAGLASTPWQHLDQTGARVDGQNQHCQVLCNPLYTAYLTTPSKDRQSVLDVLRNGRPRIYLLNEEAEELLGQLGLSRVVRAQLKALPFGQLLDEKGLTALLAERLPGLGSQQARWVLDAAAIAAYHMEEGYPVVKLLVCDDAPQFRHLTEELALCWVHEGRHYTLLTPYLAPHRQLVEAFRGRFWDYYRELLVYREQPSPAEATRLSARFDELFATVTGYQLLDARIAKTRDKKEALLKVLVHPEIELHNNPAELGARATVRKRVVSYGPRSEAGKAAWDTFMSLAETTRKLGISFFDYIHDRIRRAHQIPRLDAIITARAESLRLSPSWIIS